MSGLFNKGISKWKWDAIYHSFTHQTNLVTHSQGAENRHNFTPHGAHNLIGKLNIEQFLGNKHKTRCYKVAEGTFLILSSGIRTDLFKALQNYSTWIQKGRTEYWESKGKRTRDRRNSLFPSPLIHTGLQAQLNNCGCRRRKQLVLSTLMNKV